MFLLLTGNDDDDWKFYHKYNGTDIPIPRGSKRDMTLLQTGKILVPVHSYKGPVNLYNGSTLSEDLKDIVDEKAITVGALPSLISSTLITKIWNKNELPQALLSKRRSWREFTDSTKKQLIDHVQQNHERVMFNRCNP